MEPITESPAEPELAPAMEVQALAEDGELQAETFSFQHGFFPEPDLFSGPGFFQADFDIDAGEGIDPVIPCGVLKRPSPFA